MEIVELDLGEASYPVYIMAGAMAQTDLFARHIRGRQVMIVTNETLAPLYLEKMKANLRDYQTDAVILPDGEAYKTLETMNLVITALLEKGHNRSTTLIALGGGVVGDMTGFAAACFQRGVDFIQVPTTLLAQVDSSVGGKTAVNHALGKNMIGAFHQPQAVIIDPETLLTLPPRELAAGMAEVIKHGALADDEYFSWLEHEIVDLMTPDLRKMAYAIKRSCEIKAEIVARDEKEAGERALLNLGHTFGHAIETGLGYGEWLHGEAVGAGMVMAGALSHRLGMLSEEELRRLKTLIVAARLPVDAPESLRNEFLTLMYRDKKVTDGGLRLVLLERLGKAVLRDNVSDEDVLAVIRAG
ncbi:MAG: 3-dehydroquinate synthase [Pseudomonadales bacterium]|nr:3-dehydroquinate synthase [Pseudomonadales bacterium]